MFEFLRQRFLPVTFVDSPGHIVDTTAFEPNAFAEVSARGLELSKFGLILDASVHYQTRYRRSPSLRFMNAVLDLLPSISPSWTTNFVAFGGSESNEFQGKSSEVIAVGIAIGLSRKLFSANRAQVTIIEATTKRMDFFVERKGLRYVVEARGRKGDLGGAIDEVFRKKRFSPFAGAPHYGFLTRIPRDGTTASVVVVDPPHEPVETTRDQRIRAQLRHYARASALAGLWRLADALHERADLIESAAALRRLDGRSLGLEGVMKLGWGVEVTVGNRRPTFFVNRSPDFGLRQRIGEYDLFIGLEGGLIHLLEQQDYGRLEEYSVRYHSDTPVESAVGYFLPRDDGVTGCLVRRDRMPPGVAT